MTSCNLQAVIMKFFYSLTDEFRSTEFVKTGLRPTTAQMVVINGMESTPEVRALYESLTEGNGVLLGKKSSYLTADEIPDLLNQMQANLIESRSTAKKELDLLIAQLLTENLTQYFFDGNNVRCSKLCGNAGLPESYLNEIKEKAEFDRSQHLTEIQASNEAAERLKEYEKTRAKNEKNHWITVHGTDHLKRAFNAGYNCHRQYLEERIAIECPGFHADWRSDADWGDCACPSVEALDVLEKCPSGAKIVWLKWPHDESMNDDFQEREAIVLRNYLNLGLDLVRYL